MSDDVAQILTVEPIHSVYLLNQLPVAFIKPRVQWIALLEIDQIIERDTVIEIVRARQQDVLAIWWRLVRHNRVDIGIEESRLQPRPGLEKQMLVGGNTIQGSGLWYLPLLHEGNVNSCTEEVEAIQSLVDSLVQGQSVWQNSDGQRHKIGLHDILIVAPYNSQVVDLRKALPGAQVGTVDKFQGQQAPIVIYSMTTSSPEAAPRGMEFLYSSNRLNVATSRAKAACVLVGSPKLLEAECRSPRQMKLVNAFCRYVELAQVLPTRSR